jgi:hypothetical protein
MSDGYSSSCKVKSTKSHESRSLTQSEKGGISRLEFNNKELSRLAHPENELDIIEEEKKHDNSNSSEKQSIIADSNHASHSRVSINSSNFRENDNCSDQGAKSPLSSTPEQSVSKK